MSAAKRPARATVIVAALAACAGCGTGLVDLAREEAQGLSIQAASAAVAIEPATFFADRPLNLPSPNGRYRLISAPAAGGLTQLIAIRTTDGRRQVVGLYEPPTAVLWSPSSNSFFVNDQRGSGQSSYLEIFRLEQGRFRRDIAARSNLNRLYNRLFECNLPDEFINTSGESWLDQSTIAVELQASHHSGGCPLDPFGANQLLFMVDARSGEVQHRRALNP